MAEFYYDGQWVNIPDVAARLVRLATLTEARNAVADESLTDNTGDPTDAAYMEGINDALAAIDNLREKKL